MSATPNMDLLQHFYGGVRLLWFREKLLLRLLRSLCGALSCSCGAPVLCDYPFSPRYSSSRKAVHEEARGRLALQQRVVTNVSATGKTYYKGLSHH